MIILLFAHLFSVRMAGGLILASYDSHYSQQSMYMSKRSQYTLVLFMCVQCISIYIDKYCSIHVLNMKEGVQYWYTQATCI